MKTSGLKPEEIKLKLDNVLFRCSNIAALFRSSGVRGNLHMLNSRLVTELRTLVEAMDSNVDLASLSRRTLPQIYPFLKMYKQFSIQFPALTTEINDGIKACPGFMELMNQFQLRAGGWDSHRSKA